MCLESVAALAARPFERNILIGRIERHGDTGIVATVPKDLRARQSSPRLATAPRIVVHVDLDRLPLIDESHQRPTARAAADPRHVEAFRRQKGLSGGCRGRLRRSGGRCAVRRVGGRLARSTRCTALGGAEPFPNAAAPLTGPFALRAEGVFAVVTEPRRAGPA